MYTNDYILVYTRMLHGEQRASHEANGECND
jgi:hypothetical protein